jgi:hypothetical protein
MAEAPKEEGLGTLLHRMAAIDHRRTATVLEDLRDRLGQNGTSMDEWNALVSSASHHRLESWRRDRFAGSSDDEAALAMLEKQR